MKVHMNTPGVTCFAKGQLQLCEKVVFQFQVPPARIDQSHYMYMYMSHLIPQHEDGEPRPGQWWPGARRHHGWHPQLQ